MATDLLVRPQSQLDFDPATLPALANATFSTTIESDIELVVDRQMTWDSSGYGSHARDRHRRAVDDVVSRRRIDLGRLLAVLPAAESRRPRRSPRRCRYLRPFGLPPIVKTYTLPPNSRTTIFVDAEAAELASTDSPR